MSYSAKHPPVRLSLGFSPCPNDCFIFDALIHQKIDTEGLEFDVVMADVEELNRRAFAGDIDITKLSYHAFAYLTNPYVLLNAGSALGFGVGPLLISAKPVEAGEERIAGFHIAIPGKYTTANFLLSLAFPRAVHKTEMLFSDIEGAVLNGRVDAGLIIHENRFTYRERGLHKIIDLGEFWEQLAHAPIPLGGIVMKRNFPEELLQRFDRVLRRSVEYAFANPDASRSFVKANAQEMSEEVMYKHIDLYVNSYSIDLGKEGRKAVKTLFDKAMEQNLISDMHSDIFVEHPHLKMKSE
ncbi:MAG TPA: 1,4-dihydroxy-6-naphthoate synthase [Bacteroidia bacterium]|jgi:1,4-dihydroxy-6-naphthoate synthase|nr:1,4-dihydroxy-6-naphthoate synthase [Bacteroidia bacterium]